MKAKDPISTTLPDVNAVASVIHAAHVKDNKDAGKFTEKLPSGEDVMVPYEQLSDSAKLPWQAQVKAVYAAIDQVAAEEEESGHKTRSAR